MKSGIAAKVVLKTLKAKQPAAGRTPLVIRYGSLLDYLTKAAEVYDADREAWLGSCIEDEKLPAKTRQWERSSRRLARWAGAWFIANHDDKEAQNEMLDVFDRITKDSGIREHNIWLHIEQMKKAENITDTQIERLDKIDDATDQFLCDAIKTQLHYTELYNKAGGTELAVIEMEKKAAAQLDRIKHKIPAGKLFKQATIFPPERIPVGQPVPEYPDAYDRVQWMDPEDLEYDEQTGNLLPKEGYVSEDGLIDDHSVVFHPETGTVDIGYRGGTRTTWRYEVVDDPTETFDPTSWKVEYHIRLHFQQLESLQREIFQPRGYELDAPYNDIPVVSGQ